MSGFKCRKVGKTAGELYLYDEIGEHWGTGISAKLVADELKALGEVDTLQVRVNSPGGDVFDGFAIYNTLKRHPARVEMHIDGMALSIASVIAMAGDDIAIAENAMMMIHDPWTVAMGSAEDFRKRAEVMDQVKGNIAATYAKRSGQDVERIGEMMSAETWFTAQDARLAGLADRVTDELQVAARFDLSRFKNAPKRLAVVDRAPAGSSIYRAKIRELADRASRILAS